MSKVKLLMLIAMLGALAMISVPAYAQAIPFATGCYDPTLAAPYAVPYATFYEATSTTGGIGGFFTDPFLGGGFGCGFGGIGGGVFENTATGTLNHVTAFGLPPLRGLWLGWPC